MKQKRKSIHSLIRDVWEWFSRYIRLRDNFTCITCGKQDYSSNIHAGHYCPQSKGNRLRFDERNVHAQCDSCNRFKSGNLYVYALELQRRYGSGILEELDAVKNEVRKFTHEELEQMTEQYKQKVIEMDKAGRFARFYRTKEEKSARRRDNAKRRPDSHVRSNVETIGGGGDVTGFRFRLGDNSAEPRQVDPDVGTGDGKDLRTHQQNETVEENGRTHQDRKRLHKRNRSLPRNLLRKNQTLLETWRFLESEHEVHEGRTETVEETTPIREGQDRRGDC